MKMISIPKDKLEIMEREIKMLRNSKIYKRLLEFEHNIRVGKYIQEELGF